MRIVCPEAHRARNPGGNSDSGTRPACARHVLRILPVPDRPVPARAGTPTARNTAPRNQAPARGLCGDTSPTGKISASGDECRSQRPATGGGSRPDVRAERSEPSRQRSVPEARRSDKSPSQEPLAGEPRDGRYGLPASRGVGVAERDDLIGCVRHDTVRVSRRTRRVNTISHSSDRSPVSCHL